MKLHNWRSRLQDYLLGSAGNVVSYGHWDCAIFVGRAAESQTGVDYVGRWVGRYADFRTGLRILRQRGYRDHIDIVRQHFSEVPVAMSQEGDIAAVGDALGIVQGAHVFVLGQDGIGTVALTAASMTFRVE